MNHQYITAKKGSLEFEQLMAGTFSKTLRALPVQSLRVGSADEEVTFELVDADKVKKWTRYQVFKEFLPARKLLLVLFPVFYFVVRDWNVPQISSVELVLMISGLILSLLAVQIKVDIEDFYSGYDRIRGEKGQKVLSQGIRSVVELEKDFKVIVILAALTAILPIFLEKNRLAPLFAALALFYWGYNWGVSKRNRLNRDLALSVICGPCLAVGILPQISSLQFGWVWAFMVFFVLQLEHFQHYLAQAQAGEKNLMTMKSFDGAPNVLWSVWALAIFAYVFMRVLNSQMAVWAGSVLILVILSYQWRKKLVNLKSPAGSDIDKITLQGYQLYYAFISLWVAELLFQALVAPLVFAWFK